VRSPENSLGFAGLTQVEVICDFVGGTGGRSHSRAESGEVSEVGLDTLGSTFTSLDFGVPKVRSNSCLSSLSNRAIMFT
jgi:hypothetical protein